MSAARPRNGQNRWPAFGRPRGRPGARPGARSAKAIQSSAARPHVLERGFTLLELTVALVMLALIAALLFGSLSFAGRSWDGGETKATQLNEMRQTEEYLRGQFSSEFPLRARKINEFPLHFTGERDEILGHLRPANEPLADRLECRFQRPSRRSQFFGERHGQRHAVARRPARGGRPHVLEQPSSRRFHFVDGQRHSGGGAAKRMRWTELPSPAKRVSHTSSAVKHRTGASHVVRQWKS